VPCATPGSAAQINNFLLFKNLIKMVKISNYALRTNKEGKDFLTLELQGEVELIQSSQTGRFYATAKRCSISSTFTEDEAKALIGKQFPGRIERVNVDEYDYVIKETGEVIKLCHSYTYNPEEASVMAMSKTPAVFAEV